MKIEKEYIHNFINWELISDEKVKKTKEYIKKIFLEINISFNKLGVTIYDNNFIIIGFMDDKNVENTECFCALNILDEKIIYIKDSSKILDKLLTKNDTVIGIDKNDKLIMYT